jgi:hypothetical protein
VHARLILYKRIASATDEEGLKDLQVEMIDRFGLLPEPTKNLMRLTRSSCRRKARHQESRCRPQGGKLEFEAKPGRPADPDQADPGPAQTLQVRRCHPVPFHGADGTPRRTLQYPGGAVRAPDPTACLRKPMRAIRCLTLLLALFAPAAFAEGLYQVEMILVRQNACRRSPARSPRKTGAPARRAWKKTPSAAGAG